jgi:hypothetical protein
MSVIPALLPLLAEEVVSAVHGAQVEVTDGRLCRQVETAAGFLALQPGDRILVWWSGAGSGLILGRVAAAANPPPAATNPGKPLPEELILAARRQLILRCGEGEIIIRADGRLLIRGVDVVSKAARMQRITGGQVAIN